MTDEQAATWANVMTPSRMKKKFAELDVWLAEEDGQLVGWVGVAGDRVDGMYVEPAFARRGVGARMLDFAGRQIAAKGFDVARLEASWNAEDWYVRRGYEPAAPRPARFAEMPWPMTKKLRT